MLRLRNPDFVLRSRDPNINLNINFDSFFAFNQTSNIFHSKILYTLFSTFDFLYTDLNITFYISILAFSKKKILYV